MSSEPNRGESEAAFERIVPVAPAAIAVAAEPRRRSTHSEVPAKAVALGLGAILLLGAAIFGWLALRPTEPAQQVVATPVPAAEVTPAQQAPQASKPAPWDDAELLRARQSAQESEARFQTESQALRAQAVERWAAAEFRSAVDAGERGRNALAAREFHDAAEAYALALQGLAELARRAPEELARTLKTGAEALERGDAAAATAAYELAQAMAPDNAPARRGLERVQSLAAVTARLTQARSAESAGQIETAAEHFRAALKIDPDMASAQSGVQRTAAALAEREYQSAVAEGLAALDRGNHGGAQAAFLRARKIHPEASAVREGLARAQNGLQGTRISGLLAEAEAGERREDWSAAATQYRAALAADASLARAQEGLARSERRAQLSQRMQAHLDQPKRLQSESVYADAEAALAEARGTGAAGPLLKQQIGALEHVLSLAATPVSVRLQSDNATTVTLYKVGELGRFESRELSLRPGRYVAVGTRNGYQDVRREFEVPAEGAAAPVIVRCEERI
jgi:hypothetical protein